ncbi:ABC transporter ATP-binding protein [Candidatus Woesearchaeota archaeon]|nr:ABC transporter ATP-binding protein [Candidatus Woesearchaeota archaeon]
MKLKNVSLRLGKKQVLDDLSFSIDKKTALVGPNGSGKTMTLSVISQLMIPQRGHLFDPSNNDVLEDESFKERLGVMIQEGNFDPDRTVKEELELVKRLKNDDVDIGKLLKKYDIDNLPIKELPHGKYKIALLLQALLGKPELVILDEPFSGLDIINRKVIEKILKEYKGKLLITSHLLNDLKNVCDNIVFIKEGRVIETNKIKKIRNLDKYYMQLYK